MALIYLDLQAEDIYKYIITLLFTLTWQLFCNSCAELRAGAVFWDEMLSADELASDAFTIEYPKQLWQVLNTKENKTSHQIKGY